MLPGLIFLLLCVTYTAGELVYLQDLNDDHDKRHFDFGLPETLKFNLRHGGGELELNLKENKRVNQMAPMYVTDPHHDRHPNKAVLQHVPKNYRIKYYQDMDNGAYVMVKCDRNHLDMPCSRTLRGNLYLSGEEYKLEPSTADRRTFDVNLGYAHTLERLEKKATEFTDAIHPPGHVLRGVILEKPESDGKTIEDTVKATGDSPKEILNDLLERLARLKSVDKRAAPILHGVEILLVLDHTIYEMFDDLHSGDATIMMRLREYFCHLINGVDLKYMSIDDNDVRFYITVVGFFVTKTEGDSPWLDYSGETPDIFGGLKKLADWRSNTDGLPENDHAALISRVDVQSGLVGMAYLDALCSANSVSISRETGFFDSASTVAHELGHSLGALHDSGSPGSNCDPARQYVMSPYVPTIDTDSTYIYPWHFSECSVEQFEEYLGKLGGGSCTLDSADIYDENEYNDVTEFLPGTDYTEDEQCELIRGEGASMCDSNKNTEDVCRNFQCRSAGSSSCSRYIASYGTPCGNGMMCFDGLCTPLACKGRQCSTTIGPTEMTTTPIDTFKCEDVGFHGYPCKTMAKIIGKKNMCRYFTKECCYTCTQYKFCKRDFGKIKIGKERYDCAGAASILGYVETCYLFTSQCCYTCSPHNDRRRGVLEMEQAEDENGQFPY